MTSAGVDIQTSSARLSPMPSAVRIRPRMPEMARAVWTES